MKKLQQLLVLTSMMGMALICSSPMNAQCETWNDSDKMEEATDAHTIYRGMVNSKENKGYDSEEAFNNWQKAYTIAPAADGKRPFHYSDGRKFYMHKFKNAADDGAKKEYAEMILNLFDQEVECYTQNANTTLGLKIYDMFYVLRSPYTELKKVLEQAVESGGNDASYVIFPPYATLVVHQFKNEQMDKETARDIYQKLNEIADYNIENNKTYSAHYKQSKESMNGTFGQIEYDIFDCDFFKNKYEPEYRAEPDNWDKIKMIYNLLSKQGCAEDDPLVLELKEKFDVLVAEENTRRLQEMYKDNPGLHANDLYKEGKFDEAIEKYKQAIAMEKANGDATDNEKLGDYYFAISVIQFRKQKKYSSAREFARKASRYKPKWGQPIMLIGDMYASTSNSCGKEAWDKQMAVLAAIDKYAYAKSIDSEVAEEANEKIGRYAGHKPAKEEGFMRKVSEGQSVKVGCWIGESVKVRFK